MLAFNYASRTFAYKRLAQGLSRALSAFSSFVREYLDKVIKAHQCAQYVDDIGIAANSVTPLIRNIRAVFECIRQAGLKLSIDKCHFGVTEAEFLGRSITPQGIAPRPQNPEVLSKRKIPEIKEASTKIHRLCQLLPQLYPAVVRKVTQLLRTTESRQTDQSNRRIARQLQSDQRSASGSMQIGPQTTNHRTPIRPNE